MNLEKLLKHAKNTITKAGKIAREQQHTITTYLVKTDNSPVTHIDKKVHSYLTEHLHTYPVLSEEAPVPKQNIETYWLIDPIDGTRGYINQTTEYAIHIALIDKQQPVIGLIHQPALFATYYATAQSKAYKETPKGIHEIHVSQTKKLEQSIFAITNREDFIDHVKKYNARHITKYSYGLQTAAVASGEADIQTQTIAYPCAWDYAPGMLIVEQAGGVVTNLRGEQIHIQAQNIGKQQEIILTNKSLHQQYIQALDNKKVHS